MLSSSNSVAFADSVAQKRRLQQSENDRIHYCSAPVPSAFSSQAQLYLNSSTAATTSTSTSSSNAPLPPATSNMCTNSKSTSSSAFPSVPPLSEFREQQVPSEGGRGENDTRRDEDGVTISHAAKKEDCTQSSIVSSVGVEEETRVTYESSFGDHSSGGGGDVGVLVHVAETLEDKGAPPPSTKRLNPEAKAFVPAIGGFSYFDQYESTQQQTPSLAQRQKSTHSETPESPQGYRHRNTVTTSGTAGADSGGHSQSSMRPDFGRVVVGNHLTVEQGAQTLVEAGQDDHEHHQALDELSSQYSRGTSTRYTARPHREGGEDGQEASDYNYDDDEAEYLTNYEEYEEKDAYYDDDMDEEDYYGDDALTEEERAWLEAQCEAKDNPPDWFW